MKIGVGNNFYFVWPYLKPSSKFDFTNSRLSFSLSKFRQYWQPFLWVQLLQMEKCQVMFIKFYEL